jgi:hypothetical protein
MSYKTSSSLEKELELAKKPLFKKKEQNKQEKKIARKKLK